MELASATGDQTFLHNAKAGADEIVATWREVREVQFFIDNANLDFNHGLSGTAFTLAQVWQATGDTAYRDVALAITRYIVEAARRRRRCYPRSPIRRFSGSRFRLPIS